jgi:hypothetical protein
VRCRSNEVASSEHIARCIPRPTDAATDGGACGLHLYPPDFPADCQIALDAACCNEARGCGEDPACAKAVDCLAKCAAPRTDACTAACFGVDGGGEVPATFAALAACSKGQAFDPDGGARCSYP